MCSFSCKFSGAQTDPNRNVVVIEQCENTLTLIQGVLTVIELDGTLLHYDSEESHRFPLEGK